MRKNTRANLHSLIALMAMAGLLLAAQCNPSPQPPPPPEPPPVVDAGPPAPPPAPSSDKCSYTLDLVRSEGCTLPNDWLDACRTARAHGATFHLACFQQAQSCEAVKACLDQAG